MSEDFSYASYRKWQAAGQEIRQEDNGGNSTSETVRANRNGQELSPTEVHEYLHPEFQDKEAPTPENESLYDWVSDAEAQKVKAYRKYGSHWHETLDTETLKEKLGEIAAIKDKFRTRVRNET